MVLRAVFHLRQVFGAIVIAGIAAVVAAMVAAIVAAVVRGGHRRLRRRRCRGRRRRSRHKMAFLYIFGAVEHVPLGGLRISAGTEREVPAVPAVAHAAGAAGLGMVVLSGAGLRDHALGVHALIKINFGAGRGRKAKTGKSNDKFIRHADTTSVSAG
ncbi:MAG: hypothetical protein A2016_11600 [Elusimicrobia bacterium GWF2_62_30]|nr:MAG: hypothetical protein A2016_11600 [Elusimicrobia bacterium GWF2_62_30]